MSYGQPWRRKTGFPPAGPISTYPTFRSPASICLSVPNEGVAPGAAARTREKGAPAMVRAMAASMRRRYWSADSRIDVSPELGLPTPSEAQRVDSGAERRKGIVGQLDAFRQIGRKEYERLLGGIAVRDDGIDGQSANFHGFAIVGPDQGGVVRRISRVRELDNHAVLNGAGRKTCLQLFVEKIRSLCLGIRRAQGLLAGCRQELIASRSLHSLFVDEDEGIVGEEGLGAVARGYRGGLLYELQREGMGTDERLDRPRMRLARVGRNDGLLQGQEIFAGSDHKPVVRQGDDIRLSAAG